MITTVSMISRHMRLGDAVSFEAREMLAAGLDVPESYTGTDVTLVRIVDDNFGDSYRTEWSDGNAFDVHPDSRITVTREI